MFKTIGIIPNETKISSINTPLSREQFHICIEFWKKKDVRTAWWTFNLNSSNENVTNQNHKFQESIFFREPGLHVHLKELVYMVLWYWVIPRITISNKFVQSRKKATKNCKQDIQYKVVRERSAITKSKMVLLPWPAAKNFKAVQMFVIQLIVSRLLTTKSTTNNTKTVNAFDYKHYKCTADNFRWATPCRNHFTYLHPHQQQPPS